MSRSVNILVLFFSIPAFVFVMLVTFDIHIGNQSMADFKYRFHIIFGLSCLMAFLVALKATHRWTGIFMVKNPKRFVWSTPVSTERKKNVRLFLVLEIAIAFFLLLVSNGLSAQAWPLTFVYGITILDQLVYLFIATRLFRVGITQNAVVVVDRDVKVLYYSGLRKVDLHQQTIYFDYIEELQLFFQLNCIPTSEHKNFYNQLETHVNRDKVFFTERFKTLNS